MGHLRVLVRVVSTWNRRAPVAYCDVLTSSINCRSGSGVARTGDVVTISISVSRAVVHSLVQLNSVPFLSSYVSGRAMSTNPGMNRH